MSDSRFLFIGSKRPLLLAPAPPKREQTRLSVKDMGRFKKDLIPPRVPSSQYWHSKPKLINPHIKMTTLLTHLCEEGKFNWDDLIKYTKDSFFPDHNHFGILKKSLKNAGYSLQVYKQSTRSEVKEENIIYAIAVNKAGELILLSSDGAIIKSEEQERLLGSLLLLNSVFPKNFTAINFKLSKEQNKKVIEFPKNEFPEDIIIFITLVNDQYRLNNAIALNRRLKLSPRKDFVKFFHFVLKDPRFFENSLTKQMQDQKISTLAGAKKIRICLNSHGRAGSNSLTGNFEVNNIKIPTTWDVGKLIEVFGHLGIPRHSEIFIDVLSCEAGKETADGNAFIAHLANRLQVKSFKHVTIEGNKNIIWAYIIPVEAVIKDVRYNINSVTFGSYMGRPSFGLR